MTNPKARSFAVEDRGGRRWLIITPSRVAVVALTWATVTAALGCLLLTNHRGPAWPALVIVALALVATAVPDSWAALATQLTYAIWWLFAVRDVTTAWALPAALALLVFHVAVAHAASAPPGAAVGRATARMWCRDGVLVAGATALVAGVATAAHGVMVTGPAIVGLTLLLVVLVLGLASRRHSTTG